MFKEWLEELKVGDKVIISKRNGEYVREIERFTKTQIVLKKTSDRFNRTSGRLVGGDAWSMSSLCEGTEEKIQKITIKRRRNNLVNYILHRDYTEVSLENLEKIEKILDNK